MHKNIQGKEFYYIVWLIDDKPVGHSNITNIEFWKSSHEALAPMEEREAGKRSWVRIFNDYHLFLF